MESLTFIDSNIWCYYFDRSSQEHETVSECLEQILDEGSVAINTVVAMEVAHYLIKNIPWGLWTSTNPWQEGQLNI